MTVAVGTGFADKQQRVLALQQVLDIQREVFAGQGGVDGPLVNIGNIYNSIQDLLMLSGLDTRNKYFSDPAEFQPAPAPEEESVASEALEIAQAEVELKAAESAARHELAVKKQQDEVDLKIRELNQELLIEQAKLEQEAMLQNRQTVAELEKERIANEGEFKFSISEQVQ
jgi:DNA-binding XRE family transcriptional regulator